MTHCHDIHSAVHHAYIMPTCDERTRVLLLNVRTSCYFKTLLSLSKNKRNVMELMS